MMRRRQLLTPPYKRGGWRSVTRLHYTGDRQITNANCVEFIGCWPTPITAGERQRPQRVNTQSQPAGDKARRRHRSGVGRSVPEWM
jgi:hypothetical protein